MVSNSIKYSKEQGEISIQFETLGNYPKVYIKDTGRGISSGDIPYIFNEFYRGEKSRNQDIIKLGHTSLAKGSDPCKKLDNHQENKMKVLYL